MVSAAEGGGSKVGVGVEFGSVGDSGMAVLGRVEMGASWVEVLGVGCWALAFWCFGLVL